MFIENGNKITLQKAKTPMATKTMEKRKNRKREESSGKGEKQNQK